MSNSLNKELLHKVSRIETVVSQAQSNLVSLLNEMLRHELLPIEKAKQLSNIVDDLQQVSKLTREQSAKLIDIKKHVAAMERQKAREPLQEDTVDDFLAPAPVRIFKQPRDLRYVRDKPNKPFKQKVHRL